MTSGLGSECCPGEEWGYGPSPGVCVGGGGTVVRKATGAVSGLQTAHLPQVPFQPPQLPQPVVAPGGQGKRQPGERTVPRMLTRLAALPWEDLTAGPAGNELSIIHLLKGPLFPAQGGVWEGDFGGAYQGHP